MPELLSPLCSICSWPCCTGQEPLFSPISAPRFCSEPENFGSEKDVCCLPLCSALHGSQLSTRAAWSALAIRAFVSRMANQRLLQQIYFCTRSLEKNKGLIHMQKPPALKNEEINRTRHPSDLPAELFPPVPTVFYMMLLNVFKEAIEITISEIPFIFYLDNLYRRLFIKSKNVIIVINLNKLQTMQNLVWFSQSLGINECWWSDTTFHCLPWSPQFCYFG